MTEMSELNQCIDFHHVYGLKSKLLILNNFDQKYPKKGKKNNQ